MKLYVYKLEVPAYGESKFTRSVVESDDFIPWEDGWKLGDKFYPNYHSIGLGIDEEDADVIEYADIEDNPFTEDGMYHTWETECSGHSRGDSYINE